VPAEQRQYPTLVLPKGTDPVGGHISHHRHSLGGLGYPGSLPRLATITTNALCSDPLMPFVTPVSLVSNEASLIAVVPGRLTAGMVTGEPPLKCYVTDSCPR